jgi:hypothetical protein
MATIDPNIAMGVRPIQIENPLNQMAALSQIQSGQNQNALAQYQLSAAQRADESTNIQNQLYAKHYDPTTGRVNTQGLYGDLAKNPVTAGLIPKLQAQEAELKYKQDQGNKIVSEISKLNFETGSKIFSAAQDELKQIDPRSPNAPAQYLAYRKRLYANPELADFFNKTGLTEEATNAQVMQAIKTPQGLADTILKSMTTADQFQKILQDREQLKVSQGQLGVAQGNLGVSQQRLNAELNPDIIRSKAENIRLGTLAAEQSPLAPKVIAADAGKNLVGDVATQMGNSYLKLFESGGIKSTTRGAAANLAASSQSSMLGQIGGGVLGTENQSERDFIKSQRPILVQGIVKATGMTASQINSNVELKNLLDAATDPDKGYETNAKNLNLINKRFGTGTNIMPEKPTAATQSGINTVTTSDGKTYTFPTPAAAAQFKQAAGIK